MPRTTLKWFATIMGCLLASACCVRFPSSNGNSLGMVEPILVVDFVCYDDGGSAGLNLQDRNGKVLFICHGPHPDSRVYVGALHRDRKGAVPLVCGSIQEKDLLAMLKNYVDNHFSESEQQVLGKRGDITTMSKLEAQARMALSFIARLERSAKGPYNTESN